MLARLSARSRSTATESGSVLVGLLWCLALLTVLVVGILHSARMDLQVTRHYVDRIQARYIALAGVERAKALLYQDARDRSRSGQSHNGSLFNSPQQFRDVAFGRGSYRVFRGGRPDEGGGVIYGVSDEESRLNVNTAGADDLGRLPGMTPDIPPAIVDWRDGDNSVTPGGGEADTYAALQPPSQPRNGPLLSIREPLMIRGVPRDLFLGDDPHGTGLMELGEDDSADTSDPGRSSASGWISLLTVHSGVANVSATGQQRINLQSADEAALTSVPGITPDIAKAIIAHRGQNRIENLADLLEVGPAPQPGQRQVAPPADGVSFPPGANFAQPTSNPGGGPNPGGVKVIDQSLLLEIADSLTVEEDPVQEGPINVNTAGLEVLACLPGVSRELAQAIISYRSSGGFLANIAWLLRVPGMTTSVFEQIAPRVTTRSETFRILAEGRIKSSGVRQRIQATVRVGLSDAATLAYREDDL